MAKRSYISRKMTKGWREFEFRPDVRHHPVFFACAHSIRRDSSPPQAAQTKIILRKMKGGRRFWFCYFRWAAVTTAHGGRKTNKKRAYPFVELSKIILKPSLPKEGE